MKIAIDASRAALHERTGIEEYSYQIIKHLRVPLENHAVTLYVRRGTSDNIDFTLPSSWRIIELWAPLWWTYVRLSLALFFHRPDRLFVPGHIVPPIHPRHTTVVVHGVEFEKTPEAYSAKEIRHMRYGIQKSCHWARHIICVSNNTKRDIVDLYHVSKKKIRVVYEGVNPLRKISDIRIANLLHDQKLQRGQYLLFIGRLEKRKNVVNILKAYEILREHFGITQKLVLAGKHGFGWEEIAQEIEQHDFSEDIILTGFVDEEMKWTLLTGAAAFVFPSLYEGFGLPVLEAQQVAVPVVTSHSSSLKEIGKTSTIQVDPALPAEIARGVYDVLSDNEKRHDIINAGNENLKRFSWERSAALTAKVILAGPRT